MYLLDMWPAGFTRCLKMTKNVSLEFLAFFHEFLPTKNVNVARFARNIEWDIFHDFQTMWFIPHTSPVTIPQTPRAHTHMLSQKPSSCLLVAVLPGRKSKSGVQPIINSSRWGSFSIFYDTNGEREAVPLYLRKRECWQKLKKLFYVESKKSTLLHMYENHHDSFDIGPKCNGGTKASWQKRSDGLIHRYYFSYFIHPDFQFTLLKKASFKAPW